MDNEPRFEWDLQKAAQNKRRHRVSFEEAQTVFLDDWALLAADPDHSDEEERFLILGASSPYRLLVVCHCYRREDVIRHHFRAQGNTTRAQPI